MKRISILLAAFVTAAIVATAGFGQSGTDRHSWRTHALHVTKECSAYNGAVGDFCTITSSNIGAIQPGMKVVYLQPMAADGSLDSDLVLTGGAQGIAVGHVVLNSTTMHVTLSGGSGVFTGFHAEVAVSVDNAGIWHWDGTYSYGPCRGGGDDDE